MDQDPYCYSQHSQLIKIKCATLHISIISIRNRLIENYFNPKFGNQSERLHVILLYHYIFCWINTTYIHIWYLYLDIACSFYMFNRIILYIIRILSLCITIIHQFKVLYHHLKNSFHPWFLATPLSSRRGGAAVAPRGVVLRRSASRRSGPPGDLQPF
jgi:hypothetical protein